MPLLLPFRTVSVPSSTRRPSRKTSRLYRWDDRDEESSIVTLDPALQPRRDRSPKQPLRRQAKTLTNQKHAAPSRRPRRSASPPPRNPYNVDIPNVPLKPLKFPQDVGYQLDIELETARPLNQVMATNTSTAVPKNNVSLVFCIRRTGCGACRGHAMQLASLVESMPDVSLMGVIKPEAVPEERLLEFYIKYFPFPLYQDDDWSLFAAMGNRKLSVWSMIKNAPKLAKHYQEQNTHNIAFGGDLYTLGGLLIFDAQQQLRFVYYEKYGEELDTDALTLAIEEAKIPVAGAAVSTTLKPPSTSDISIATAETEDLTGSGHTYDDEETHPGQPIVAPMLPGPRGSHDRRDQPVRLPTRSLDDI